MEIRRTSRDDHESIITEDQFRSEIVLHFPNRVGATVAALRKGGDIRTSEARYRLEEPDELILRDSNGKPTAIVDFSQI